MSKKRIIILRILPISLVVATSLLLLGLHYYLRLPPHHQLQFISNDGWAFRGDCGTATLVLGNGQCFWKLSTYSYFAPIGDATNTTNIALWCQQNIEDFVSDFHSPYLGFIYSHAIPMWSDTCPQDVVIVTSLSLTITIK
jgi:hypothetical protein